MIQMNRRRMNPTFNYIMGSLMILFGIGAGLFSVYDGFLSWRLKSTGLSVDATVVDTVLGSQKNGGTASAPVFEYVVYDQTFRYTSRNESYPPRYRIGDHATLVVDPNDPNKAREDSFTDLWLLPAIMCPTSIVSILAALLVIAVVRMRGANPSVTT